MIKLFVMDVDGTLTDGGIYYDNTGNEFKRFDVKDGAGIVELHKHGVKTMILTGRSSKCVERRAQELKVDYIIQGVSDKAAFLEGFLKDNKIGYEETAYIGDDLNDLECINLVGNTACPFDATEKVKNAVHCICESRGGYGAVREFIDYILKELLYLQPLEDEENAWYLNHRVRAHAGGGIDGNMYTNSMDAIINSYNNGMRIAELDVTITSDEIAVISHNFMPEVTVGLSELPNYDDFMKSKICNKYTPMSLRDLINFLYQHKDFYVVLDHPAKGLNQLKKIITQFMAIIDGNPGMEEIYDRTIVQVFKQEEHEWMKSLGKFKNLEYYFSYKRDIEGAIPYIINNKIHTVSINRKRLTEELLDKFNRLNVKVYSPSINEPDEVREAFRMGCWGITSDFITEENLKLLFS